ncbi:MAG: hypothetical protein EHJ94_02440 [Deltaproteobacteria bacterium]|nr:MAG: hypothetical protein EHJ94_02440 [Deltaproteobacteria bacterium]
MAKCSVCMKVKGKRNCKVFSGVVCALCCGTSRDESRCAGCSFYKTVAEMRRYDKTQYFSTLQMADNQELQDAGDVIEGAMCVFDHAQTNTIKDGFLKNVLERLLDRYAFGDKTLLFSDDLEREGFAFIDAAIKEDLSGVESERLSKVIATVYRSIKRHADGSYGGRKYIDFIHQHVGTR